MLYMMQYLEQPLKIVIKEVHSKKVQINQMQFKEMLMYRKAGKRKQKIGKENKQKLRNKKADLCPNI